MDLPKNNEQMCGIQKKWLKIDGSNSNIKLLRDYIHSLQEESAKLEHILKLLSVTQELINLKGTIAKLQTFQINADSKECTVESIGLSIAERQRKTSNYASKLKICIKIYANLNDKLTNELKLLKSQLHKSMSKIALFQTIDVEGLKRLELKLKRYADELLKFEKKYPWMKDPQLTVSNFTKEIDTLNTLRHEKRVLSEELSSYQGLKPSVYEASEQLQQVKREYEQLKRSF